MIQTTFFNAALFNLVRYGMAAWFGALSVKCKNKPQELINIAIRITGNKDIPQLCMSSLRTPYLDWQAQFLETQNRLFIQELSYYLLEVFQGS